jgi:hypothetical protein
MQRRGTPFSPRRSDMHTHAKGRENGHSRSRLSLYTDQDRRGTDRRRLPDQPWNLEHKGDARGRTAFLKVRHQGDISLGRFARVGESQADACPIEHITGRFTAGSLTTCGIMTDSARMAAQANPVRNVQFQRRWLPPPRKSRRPLPEQREPPVLASSDPAILNTRGTARRLWPTSWKREGAP